MEVAALCAVVGEYCIYTCVLFEIHFSHQIMRLIYAVDNIPVTSVFSPVCNEEVVSYKVVCCLSCPKPTVSAVVSINVVY